MAEAGRASFSQRMFRTLLVCSLALSACQRQDDSETASPPPQAPPSLPPVPMLVPQKQIETPHRAILSMDINAAGTRALTGGRPGGDVILWDLKTGQELQRLKGHEGTVTGVALSADGRRAITTSRDRTARVWDVETGKQLHVLRGHKWPVLSAAISADGSRGLTTSDGFILRETLNKGESCGPRDFANWRGREMWRTRGASACGRGVMGGDPGRWAVMWR